MKLFAEGCGEPPFLEKGVPRYSSTIVSFHGSKMSTHHTATRIAIRHGGPATDMTLDLLREIGGDDFKGKTVLVKPNAGFKSVPGSGVITNCEVVRGVVRFLKEAGANRILVGDSSILGVDPDEALEASGIAGVAREEGCAVVNLENGDPVTLTVSNPMAVDRIKVSSIALEADKIVSVPVMKTHMHARATLGIKNMKGCLHGRQKTQFHHLKEQDRFSRWHDYKALDRAIADLSSVLLPDLVVIDGTMAMEGLGPMIGDPKPMHLVLGGQDPIAVDAAAAYLMGLTPDEPEHLFLAATKRGRTVPRLEEIDCDRSMFATLRSPFKPAVAEDVSAQYPEFVLAEGESCSACHATVMAFLKVMGRTYADKTKTQLAFGRDIDPDALTGDRLILLGNCTAKLRGRGEFLEGCPPVPSDIVRAMELLKKK